MSGKLVLVRHGESVWNALGKWTGWSNIGLSEKGKHDAELVGEKIADIKFPIIFTSELKRTHQTLSHILKTHGQADENFKSMTLSRRELNERDYGDYTALDKWNVKEKLGEERFNAIRRNYDEPIPHGETLHDVYNRVVPFYQDEILPYLERGLNVLVVAHGNSIRALVKYIENISDADISKFEMTFDTILIYTVDEQGHTATREVRKIDIEKSGKA